MDKVFLDTSALPRSFAKPNQAFSTLSAIAKEGYAELLVSHVTVREWTSQFAIACEAALQQASKAIRDVLRQPLSAAHSSATSLHTASEAVEAIDPANLRDLADTAVDRFLEEHEVTVVPSEEADSTAMWDSYFCGNAPFRGVKTRDDIPDFFIYAAAKRIAGQMGSEQLHCIAGDNRLRDALSSVASVLTYDKIETFLDSAAGKTLIERTEVSRLWQADSKQILEFITKHDSAFFEQVKEASWDQLPDYFEVEGAPGDTGTASISSVQEISEVVIDWSQMEEISPGWVSVPFTLECELELEFSIYRSDAFDVPEWVHVTMGDFERDHYFDATGCRQARATGQLRMQFSAEQLRERTWDAPEIEVEFEEVELVEE